MISLLGLNSGVDLVELRRRFDVESVNVARF
jgi:hypothetical protein